MTRAHRAMLAIAIMHHGIQHIEEDRAVTINTDSLRRWISDGAVTINTDSQEKRR